MRVPQKWAKKSRLVAIPLAAALGAGLLCVQVLPAVAAGCYASSCNGDDPVQTGCSVNAVTVGQGPVVDWTTGKQIGTVQLRWSKTCQANWGRAYFWDGNPRWTPRVDIGLYREADNQTMNWLSYSGAGSPVWGNMAAIPGCAYVDVFRGNAGGQAVQNGCPPPSGP